MNLEDKPLVDMIDLERSYEKRAYRELSITDVLLMMGRNYCKQYNAEMWGVYYDKANAYFRVQYKLPKA